MTYMDKMFKAYVECALWSSVDDEGHPMDRNHDSEDIAPEALSAMRTECATFMGDLAGACQEHNTPLIDADQAGHDFWLTRNHHGAGFWDRGLGALGDLLTKIAQSYGESDLYVGDNGHLYV